MLWCVLSVSVSAAMVSPIAGGEEGQIQYTVELQSIRYFYRLNIYDDNEVLLDSTIQFTKGENLDAFVLENEKGDFEIMVVMTIDEVEDTQDIFSFDGSSLSKITY